MIVNNRYKSVEIDIITYQRYQRCSCISNNMNESKAEKGYRKNNQNRFICSICLNKKQSQEENRSIECCKRISKSCPICQRNCEANENKITINSGHNKNDTRHKERVQMPPSHGKDGKNMYIQTSQPDVTKGLTLLNEVLTVFQSKKQIDSRNDNRHKTVILKDACVVTDIKHTPKLTVSRTFVYSLEENEHIQDQNGKFSVINWEPDSGNLFQFSIDLIKHKSSSIPQMKLEELKNSLKEKTQSKDAIEEVNRMFATVRKHELKESIDDSNRPMIRNGPRVLPVVKTNVHNSDLKNQRQEVQHCSHCETNYHNMCSGDSFMKPNCCHNPNICEECFKSSYHYKQSRFPNTKTVCEHCCNLKDCKQT